MMIKYEKSDINSLLINVHILIYIYIYVMFMRAIISWLYDILFTTCKLKYYNYT